MTVRFEWHAPDGATVLELDVPDRHGAEVQLSEITGDGPPAHAIIRSPVVAGGSRAVGGYTNERILGLTLNVIADAGPRFVTLWRDLVAAFTQTRDLGPGRFRVIGGAEEWVEVECRYLEGLDAGYGDGELLGIARPMVSLLAEDPFWYGPRTPTLQFDYGDPVGFLSPDFPSLAGEGTTSGPQLVRIEGDSDAWPVWTIGGPCDEVTISRAGGRSFTIDGPPTGTYVVVTDPRVRSVRTGAGDPALAALHRPADLFPLRPGRQRVTIDMLAGDEGAFVALTYRPRWESRLT